MAMQTIDAELRKIPCPSPTGKMGSSEMINKIRSLPGFQRAEIHPKDNWFSFYPVNELQKFMNALGLHQIEYVPEIFDCENFAESLRVLEKLWIRKSCPAGTSTALGWFKGALWFTGKPAPVSHEMGLFCDPSGQFFLLEPRKGLIISSSHLRSDSQIDLVVI